MFSLFRYIQSCFQYLNISVQQIPLPKHLSQNKSALSAPVQHVTQQTKPSALPVQQTKVQPPQSKISHKPETAISENSSKEKLQKAKKNKAEKSCSEYCFYFN